MIERCIEIRGNLNAGYKAHVQRVAVDAAREKEERERKIAEEKEKRAERFKEFKQTHFNLCEYGYVSEYNFENISPYSGGYCRISFYEWGDIGLQPRTFDYYGPFYEFLDECGLRLTKEQVQFIRPLQRCFVTCKPDSPEMVIGKTYEELKDLLEKGEEEKKPEIEASKSRDPYYNDDEDDDEYAYYNHMYGRYTDYCM